MKEPEYWYWEGFLSMFEDLPDGAWWSCCEAAIGGYDKFMEFLKAGEKYNPKVYKRKQKLKQ
jgi:hypothetical protein